MKIIFSLLLIVSFHSYSQIWSNDITGTNPNTANPYTTGQTVDGSITVSGIGRGSGIAGTNANNRYNATGWNSALFDANDYFYFTLTPTTGCHINFTTFIYTSQASSASGMSFAVRSSIDGYTTDIATPTSTGTTVSLSGAAYQNITGPITFRIYAWGASAAGGTFSINDFVFNGSVVCGPPSSITTGSVSAPPFGVTCTTSASGTVAFTSTGTFGAGNTYTAQLSDATGSFTSPVTIGTLASTANNGSIAITIPSGTASGSGYQIRIISSTPATTGSLSSAFTITLTDGPCVLVSPHVTSLIFDGCNSACSNEGESEIVFATTGGYSVSVTSANIDLNYTTGGGYDLLGTIVNVPATTTAINTASGCSGLYVNGFGQTIPPNSKMLFLSSSVCLSAFDWAALCGQGPIYVIYGQSGTTGNTWINGGNFGNVWNESFVST